MMEFQLSFDLNLYGLVEQHQVAQLNQQQLQIQVALGSRQSMSVLK